MKRPQIGRQRTAAKCPKAPRAADKAQKHGTFAAMQDRIRKQNFDSKINVRSLRTSLLLYRGSKLIENELQKLLVILAVREYKIEKLLCLLYTSCSSLLYQLLTEERGALGSRDYDPSSFSCPYLWNSLALDREFHISSYFFCLPGPLGILFPNRPIVQKPSRNLPASSLASRSKTRSRECTVLLPRARGQSLTRKSRTE